MLPVVLSQILIRNSARYSNSIVDYKWQLIPIDEKIAEPDQQLGEYISSFQTEVDRKYNSIICKLSRKHTHPRRDIETSLGNLIADAFAEIAECDVMLVGSGSIRSVALGPLVTLKDLMACFPFDDILTRYVIDGAKLKRIFTHIMRPSNRNSEGECYQVNGKVKAIYDDASMKLISLSIDGQEVPDATLYRICLAGYHVRNSKANLNVTNAELMESGRPKVISTSAYHVLDEYLRNHQNISREVEGRLTYLNTQ